MLVIIWEEDYQNYKKRYLNYHGMQLKSIERARKEVTSDPELLAEWLTIYTRRYDDDVPDKFAVLAKDNWLGLIDIDDIFIKFYGWNQ